MRFVCGNVWTRVQGASGTVTQALWDHLSVENQGARHSQAYKAGRWDGKEHLYDRRRDRFPTGLLRMALACARDNGAEPEVIDSRGSAPGHFVAGAPTWLRDYQADALAACRRRTRGIVQAPTGSGKGTLMVGVAHSLDVPIVALVSSKDLVTTLADRFDRYASGGEKAGVVGAGRRDVQRFTVMTYQALRYHWDALRDMREGARALLVDEAHELPADGFYKAAMAFGNTYWRYGFSATPLCRRDAQELRMVAALGGVVHKIDPGGLIERGHLARPYVRFVRFEHGADVGKSYEAVYEAAVIRNRARNQVVVDLAIRRSENAPTIVFVRSIPHGRILREMLVAAGVPTRFVHGKVSNRLECAEQLARRDLRVVVASTVFNKGVDIPELAVGINAAGGDSPVDAIQRLGRVLRGPNVCPGKRTCEFWDLRDRGQHWLSRHAKHRADVYREYGFEPEFVDDVATPVQEAFA